ncbi:diguanylate cyclase (GGDEF)-like protein/PAS domain S-box-containing protein [Aurantimonas endophytica]|uniref:diguanylate cyclase n=2 Tax=Aurantimonas endophytica TaxID=1522175 RepID=A0A7W6HAA2_9HYPH|nr:diguanylate cyclase (GGDEF)-like protein/PAS domain S-box-containing protein [Aurantimonas endophytica]
MNAMMREAKYHTFAVQLMEHLVVPTFVLDAAGRVIIWNRACERMTGVPASAVLGTRRHWTGFYQQQRRCLADLVLEGASARVAEFYEIDRSLDCQTGALSAENWCVFPTGRGRRYLAIDAGPIYADDGTLIAVVETLRDITAQKEAQSALELLASLDGLTGIANRRAFDVRFESEWELAARSGQPLSLLMIDIDHFKIYNDHLGHQCGDDCLKRIAQIIVGETRGDVDIVARYGGEEFAVVLPHAGLDGALSVAHRILEATDRAAIPHHEASSQDRVTISIGAASRNSEMTSPADLIAAADASLYAAKQRGRNLIVAQRSVAA